MPYNSTNLPLSPWKILKKTILRGYHGFILGIVTLIVGLIIDPNDEGLIFTKQILIYGGLLLAIIPALVAAIYEYLYYKLYYYSFSDAEAIIRKGVISRSTGHVLYPKIQNIYVDQDWLDRILGLYDVHYETAGEQSGFYSHVDGLNGKNSATLTDFLNDRAKRNLNRPVAQTIQNPINEKMTSPSLSRKELLISPLIIFIRTIGMSIFLGLPAITFVAALMVKLVPNQINIAPLFQNHWIAIALLMIVSVIILLIYNLIWFNNYYFEFSSDKGLIRERVIGQSIAYLYYDRIQNITILQGTLDRLFGIYGLSIETAGEASSTSLKIYGMNLQSAERLRNFLLEKTKRTGINHVSGLP